MNLLKLSLLLSVAFAGSAFAMEPATTEDHPYGPLALNEILNSKSGFLSILPQREFRKALLNLYYHQPTYEGDKLLNQPNATANNAYIPSELTLKTLIARKKLNLYSVVTLNNGKRVCPLYELLTNNKAFNALTLFITHDAVTENDHELVQWGDYDTVRVRWVQLAKCFISEILENDKFRLYLNIYNTLLKFAPERIKPFIKEAYLAAQAIHPERFPPLEQ